MSEEEIINTIKTMLKSNEDIFDEAGTYLYFRKSVAECVQGLLDLYNKEKEKNEYLLNITYLYDAYEVNNEDKIIVADKRFFDSGLFVKKFISKDKIKEKIKEYEDFRKEYPVDFRKNKMRSIIIVLKELLEDTDE